MGHTTRCLPLIQCLLDLGCIPVFAGNDAQKEIATSRFPSIETTTLNGYRVGYSRIAWWFMPRLLMQVPKVWLRIVQEHQWLKQAATALRLDGVISDNRYGLYHSNLPCVIMTHQLRILSGLGSFWDDSVQQVNYRLLNRFDQTWVVDVAQAPGLSGDLAHPAKLPTSATYIGLLSHLLSPTLERRSKPTGDAILILLSGPEPQRTLLHDRLWEQLKTINRPVFFVAGNRDAKLVGPIPPHVQFFPQVDSRLLNTLLDQTSTVVCRSGYSTLMDLTLWDKEVILIPTPGQTEQAYLADLHASVGKHRHAHQEKIDLNIALAENQHKVESVQQFHESSYLIHRQVIADWVAHN